MLFVIYGLFFVTLYFVMFMLISFFGAHAPTGEIIAHQESGDPALLPSVTIIVPCYNEAQTLSATMDSLLALEYPQEKICFSIVNDGSRDDTLAVAQRYADRPNVRIFDKPNGGKYTAMNLALEHATTDLIGCLDADSVVDPRALMVIAPLFMNHAKLEAVTPGILIKKPETLVQHMQDAEYRLSIFNRFTLAALGSAFITPGPFSIYRTRVVQALGGWHHAHATEDLEMALRIQMQGGLIANAPGAKVYTGSPRTIAALFKQRVRWTYGFLRNAIDYRHMFANGAFGNLSIIILPGALVSIFVALFFSIRVVYFFLLQIWHAFEKWQILGFQPHVPSLTFFYINTSMLILLVLFSVVIVLFLIAYGTSLISGYRRLPVGTIPFVMFFSFIAPLWLGTACIRAILNTGVEWEVNRNV